jgi:hypothetical protein
MNQMRYRLASDPLPDRPFYCDMQIIPTSECCNLVPTTEEYTTMQRYRTCFDINMNGCVEIDQTGSLTGCGLHVVGTRLAPTGAFFSTASRW